MTEPCGICKYHEGIREKLEANLREMDLRSQSLERAIDVAKMEMDRRLESMNEFRAQLTRQAVEFISRKEVEGLAKELDLKIAPLKEKSNVREGSDEWVRYLIILAISVFLSIVIPRMFK